MKAWESFKNAGLLLAAALCAALAAPSFAQRTWRPEGPVEIVVPSAPGGGTDHTARVMQKIWQERKLLEVPVNVVNKSGGGGSVALTYLQQFNGNGHYLHSASAVLLTNHIVGRSPVNYTDLTPIALLQSEYVVLAVKSDSPIKTAKDMVARLKADPAALSFAVGTSLGGANHSAAAVIARAAGADPKKIKAVVFKSSSESATAALGGHVDVMSASASLVLPHLRAGTMRVLGVTAPRRLTGELSSVPTLREQGLNADVNNFRLLTGPAGMTPAQIAYWEQSLLRFTESEEWKKELETNFWRSEYMRSAEMRKYLEQDNAQARSFLAELGLAK